MRIMASLDSSSSMEPTAVAGMMSRRRLLHTCGVSILAIVHKACTKAQDFNGPVGSMTKRIVTLFTSSFPFINAIQYQWLAILSFVDDHILAVENMIETLFPSSAGLFNKIDKLVHTAEALPGKFDDAMNKFPKIIHQVPFLDWALVYLISCLNFLISMLTHWGYKSTREKEIRIDMSFNNLNNESGSAEKVEKSLPMSGSLQYQTMTVGEALSPVESPTYAQNETKTVEKGHCPAEPPTHIKYENVEKSYPKFDSLQGETGTFGTTVKLDVMKCSYKEMLERGTKENTGKKEDCVTDQEICKAIVSEEEVGDGAEKDANKSHKGIVSEDPILELFEASWHMNPGRRR